MPYIIKNGKTYTGNSVTLTQAQYDALSEAEKNNGIAYYIYDSNAVLDADDVALDNGTVEDLAGSVAVIETSPATATHAVGDFILWNGQLYTVISPIEVGQDLTVGSNITATSAGSELTSLKSGLTIHTASQEVDVSADKTISGLPTGFVVIQIRAYHHGYSITYDGAMAMKDGMQVIYQSNSIRVINSTNAKWTMTFRYVVPI